MRSTTTRLTEAWAGWRLRDTPTNRAIAEGTEPLPARRVMWRRLRGRFGIVNRDGYIVTALVTERR